MSVTATGRASNWLHVSSAKITQLASCQLRYSKTGWERERFGYAVYATVLGLSLLKRASQAYRGREAPWYVHSSTRMRCYKILIWRRTQHFSKCEVDASSLSLSRCCPFVNLLLRKKVCGLLPALIHAEITKCTQ